MKRVLIASVLGFSLMISGGEALPLFHGGPVGDVAPVILVKLSASQKNAARKICRRKFGERLASVTFSGRNYYCNYRQSTKVLTRNVARQCRKNGLKLDKVMSIRIKGKQSITRYRCKR